MARLTTGSMALTVLLAALTALAPLSTDLYLPSLPSIARAFGVSNGDAQLTLSAYLLGLAIGLPLYGPFSDRRGRKTVILFGLILFGIANALASIAPDLNTLIAARMLQGFSVAAPQVVARSIVRDMFEGRRAAQELARMGAIMAIVPALAPVLGAMLEIGFGWRANFVACAMLVAGLAVVTNQRLPETLQKPLDGPFSLMAILRTYRDLLFDRRFLPFAALNGLTYCGLFAFISASSFVFQLHFGFNEVQFAFVFLTVVCGFIIGGYVSQRLALRYSGRHLLMVGASLQAVGGLSMLAMTVAFVPIPLGMMLSMMLYTMGQGFTFPQSMAGAMMPFPERAGSASSLLSIVQMSSASLVGATVGRLIDRGPAVLAIAVAICGVCALLILPFIHRPKEA